MSNTESKPAEPKVERLESNGISLEKTTWPDGRERVIVLDSKKTKPSNPKSDV